MKAALLASAVALAVTAPAMAGTYADTHGAIGDSCEQIAAFGRAVRKELNAGVPIATVRQKAMATVPAGDKDATIATAGILFFISIVNGNPTWSVDRTAEEVFRACAIAQENKHSGTPAADPFRDRLGLRLSARKGTRRLHGREGAAVPEAGHHGGDSVPGDRRE